MLLKWISATDPWGTTIHVRLEDVMALGQGEHEGKPIGLLWMRNTAIQFRCSLDELEVARGRLLH